MKEKILKMIDEKQRKNIVYIHPVTTPKAIARYISGLANGEGGVIVLGVSDDGVQITPKNYPFSFSKENIKNLLDNDVDIKCGSFEYEKGKLAYIQTPKSVDIVKSEGVGYVLNDKREVIEMEEKKVFLSYCSKDIDIANIIEERITDLGKGQIIVSRYDKVLKYKDSLDEFMKSIKEHDFVISIISDFYLKSPGCMYEITELMKDENYYSKLLFVIMSDEDIIHYKNRDIKGEDIKAKVYSIERFDYITYWNNAKQEIDKKALLMPGTEFLVELSEESKKFNSIATHIGAFTTKLSDGFGKRFQDMLASDFNEFLSIILK